MLLPLQQLWAQTQTQPTIDQLLKQLQTSKEDTNKVNLLDQVAERYIFDSMSMQNFKLYTNQEFELSRKLGWTKGLVNSYRSLAQIEITATQNKAAINYLEQAYHLARQGKLTSLQYGVQVWLADLYAQIKNYGRAISNYKEAVEYYVQSKEVDPNNWFSCRRWWSPALSLGYIYSSQKNDAAATIYLQQLLDRCTQEKDTLGIQTALNVYIRFYNDYKKDYDKSLEYCFRELHYFKPGDTTSAHASVITYIANAYRIKKDYVRALEYYRHAIALKPVVHPDIKFSANAGMREIYRLLEDYNKMLSIDLELYRDAIKRGDIDMMMSGYYSTLASDYVDVKKFDSAMFYMNKSIDIIKKLNGKIQNRDLLNSLAYIYYFSRRYDEALRTVKESISIKGVSNTMSSNDNEYDLYPALLYQGMIVRDAPDSVLRKYGIPRTKRYQEAIKSLKPAVDYFTKINSLSFMPLAYKELSIAYDSIKDYKRFHDTYKKYIALRDSSVNRTNQNAFISRLADIQFEKKEDSLKYQQRLTNDKLKQQTLLTTQQQKYYISGIIALLALSFFITRNYYNQRKSNRVISAEKQRSDNLLLNILPADVAEELKEKGTADARLFEEVTVLFTDFVNFTTISELLTPQELVNELHYCFKAFDEIVGGYGIEKIKTIGDAYLAVAGLPNTDVQHAKNTVRAALEIRQFIHDRKQRMGNRSFDIRIGIHSGSVVAGIVGVKKFAYDIWGDTVNTAARMEQHSLPGQINLSEKTYELVKDQFAFTYRGEIEAKNKGSMKMYFVEKQSASVGENGLQGM